MSWSYSGDPSATPLDSLRFFCGDTDSSWPLLQDEELSFLLVSKGNSPRAAAPDACTLIMAKFAREVDYAIGPEKVSASQRFEQYKALLGSLRTLWSGANAAPSFQDPTTTTHPAIFDVGMHDNKGC